MIVKPVVVNSKVIWRTIIWKFNSNIDIWHKTRSQLYRGRAEDHGFKAWNKGWGLALEQI